MVRKSVRCLFAMPTLPLARFKPNAAPERLSLSALGILLTVSTALAQYPSGKLVGVVKGPGDKARSGLSVRLARSGSSPVLETITDARGAFSFAGLLPGPYTLDLLFPVTRGQWQSQVEIRAATTLELEIILSPAGGTPAGTTFSRYSLERDAWWGTEFPEGSRVKLPNARNVWSILESQEPSTVTNRLDVGGLETGVPALFGALGSSWTENQFLLSGFDVTDPYIPGRPVFDPDLVTRMEFQVVSAAKPALDTGSGAVLAFQNLEPSPNLHGATRLFYSSRRFQSDNMDARLRRLQFPGPERLNHLVDGRR